MIIEIVSIKDEEIWRFYTRKSANKRLQRDLARAPQFQHMCPLLWLGAFATCILPVRALARPLNRGVIWVFLTEVQCSVKRLDVMKRVVYAYQRQFEVMHEPDDDDTGHTTPSTSRRAHERNVVLSKRNVHEEKRCGRVGVGAHGISLQAQCGETLPTKGKCAYLCKASVSAYATSLNARVPSSNH